MPEIYTPLNNALEQIRLLVLHPGQGRDELSGTFKVASLQEDEKAPELAYDALSYVWGPNSTEPTPPQIRLDPAGLAGAGLHIPLQITPNLDKALRVLRHVHKPRTIWVDAVCINQQDIPERNAQVALMRSIYERATRVAVWLGPEEATDHAAAIVDFFRRLENSESKVEIHWSQAFILPCHPPGTALDALDAFFRRPWWRRTWTFQEVAVARDVVLHAGDRTFSWNCLCSMVSSFQRHMHHWRCCAGKLGPNALHGIMANLEEIIEYRNNRSELDVLDFISWNRHRDATDPRDKIFGFTGLRPSSNLFDKSLLDYALPVDEVYRRWALHLIVQTHSLDIFSHIIPRTKEASSSSRPDSVCLPSWVPDWMQTPDHVAIMSLQNRIRFHTRFNAAGRTHPHLSMPSTSNSNEIALCGTAVDHVVAVLESAGNVFSYKVPTLHRWREAVGVDQDPSRPYVPRVGGTILEAFRNTIFPCAESILSTDRMPMHVLPTPKDWMMHDAWYFTRMAQSYEWEMAEKQGIPPSREMMQSLSGGPGIIENNIDRFVADKCMFITEEGYIGLGPETVQQGDHVVVLLGGRMPFLLREKPTAEVTKLTPARYELVGTCSVYGLIDGEAIDRVEDGDLVLQDFVLV